MYFDNVVSCKKVANKLPPLTKGFDYAILTQKGKAGINLTVRKVLSLHQQK